MFVSISSTCFASSRVTGDMTFWTNSSARVARSRGLKGFSPMIRWLSLLSLMWRDHTAGKKNVAHAGACTTGSLKRFPSCLDNSLSRQHRVKNPKIGNK